MQLLSPKLALSEKIGLAQSSKLLVRVENDQTGDALIYFVYRSKQTGRIHRYALGHTWREAEYFLLDERNYQLRQLFEQALYRHNLDKFSSLAEACFQQGPPTERRLELLERFCQQYDIPVSVAFQVVQNVKSKQVAIQEKSFKASVPFQAAIAVRSGKVSTAEGITSKSWFSALTWKSGVTMVALLVALGSAFLAGRTSVVQTSAVVAKVANIAKPRATRKVATTSPKTRKATTNQRSIATR